MRPRLDILPHSALAYPSIPLPTTTYVLLPTSQVIRLAGLHYAISPIPILHTTCTLSLLYTCTLSCQHANLYTYANYIYTHIVYLYTPALHHDMMNRHADRHTWSGFETWVRIAKTSVYFTHIFLPFYFSSTLPVQFILPIRNFTR